MKPAYKKRGIRWPRVALLVGAVAVLTIIGVVATTWGTDSYLQQALAMGRLAQVPKSAWKQDFGAVKEEGKKTIYVRFAAPEADINEFIAGSPGLAGVTPQQLGPGQMYLPRAASQPAAGAATQRALAATQAAVAAGTPAASEPAGNVVYYTPPEKYPWFDPMIRVRGRRYVIPKDHEGNHGEVIINDDAQVVFIRMSSG